MLAFSIGALGMIGVPPVAGFVSKWYLGLGGLQAGQGWVIAVLAGSSLLNAAYFLPLLYRAWFLPPPAQIEPVHDGPTERPLGLILPAVITAAAALGAASNVDLCKVPRRALERLIANNPALEHRLMQQTLRELDEARDWMVTLGRKTAAEKVASFLLLIATHIDPQTEGKPVIEFDLPLSRADTADFLGLTLETVSRQLSKLRTERVIVLSGNRRVEILDLDALGRRCG